MENCAICVEPLDPATAATLECGHAFHPSCAIQWFRYHHTSCPLCRSDGMQHRWTAATPAQRIQGLKRNRSSLSHAARVRLHRYEELHRRTQLSQKTFSEYRARHRDVIREYVKQHAALCRAKRAKQRVQNELVRIHVPEVPHLLSHTSAAALPQMVESDLDEEDDDEF